MSLLNPRQGDSGKNHPFISRQELKRRAQQKFDGILVHFRHDFSRLEGRLPRSAPMSVYEELNEIKVALQNDIEYLMRSPRYDETDDVTYLFHIRMEPDYGGVWQPRLVILCGTEKLCSYLEANLSSSSDGVSRLSRPPAFELHVRSSADQEPGLFEEPGLLYRDSTTPYDNSILGSQWWIEDKAGEESHNWMGSVGYMGWKVTVGGVILVDDVPYGLTVGHYKSVPPVLPLYADDDSQRSSSTTRGFRGEVMAESCGSQDGFNTTSDWALVKMDRSLSIANRLGNLPYDLQSEETTKDTFIIYEIMSLKTFITLGRNEGRLQCLIVTRHELFPAFVEVGTSTMGMGGKSFEVLKIDLDQELPWGCSGSWVIVNSQLLGTIIATQRETEEPQAFAIPIEATFRSIKAVMSADRVELPSNVETRIFELERSSPVCRWSAPAAFELDLLYAMKQSERSRPEMRFSFGGSFAGTGWLGMRREEILKMGPSFADSITDAKFRTRTYETLTGLKMETIRSLIRIGHIFPAHRMFRTGLRKWIAEHKVSHLRGSRAIGIRLILEECLGTEAGENLLGLVCTLKNLLQVGERYTKSRSRKQARDERRTIWIRILFCSLFRALEIPPTEIPSEPQLHVFISHCMLGFKGAPEIRLNQQYRAHETPLLTGASGSDDKPMGSLYLPETYLYNLPGDEDYSNESLFSVDFLARMLLQLGDVAHSGGDKILVCSGYPWAFWAQAVAHVLGIGVHVRSHGNGGEFEASAMSDNLPSVCVFTNIASVVSEVINRDVLPSGLSADEMVDLWDTTASERDKGKGKRLMLGYSSVDPAEL